MQSQDLTFEQSGQNINPGERLQLHSGARQILEEVTEPQHGRVHKEIRKMEAFRAAQCVN
jgi:hypothetical protein